MGGQVPSTPTLSLTCEGSLEPYRPEPWLRRRGTRGGVRPGYGRTVRCSPGPEGALTAAVLAARIVVERGACGRRGRVGRNRRAVTRRVVAFQAGVVVGKRPAPHHRSGDGAAVGVVVRRYGH